jgi:Kef-type K+ transport system membrane component KefB
MAGMNDFVFTGLLALWLFLIVAKVADGIAKRFSIAAVIGEILADVIIEPRIFGGINMF